MSYLEKQFTFYASYHNDFTNQVIHIICIPILLFTALTMLQFTPPLMDGSMKLDFTSHPVLNSVLPASVEIEYNSALIIAAMYSIFYFFVELPHGIVGVLASLMVVAMFIYSAHIQQTMPDSLQTCAIIHVFSWVFQFAGHGVWEKRAPALLDGIVQAFAMAPLFVVMELFFMFGYRSEFRERVQKAVDVNIGEFKSSLKGGKAK
jgi:uncharacterized membrane protein YGL010W